MQSDNRISVYKPAVLSFEYAISRAYETIISLYSFIFVSCKPTIVSFSMLFLFCVSVHGQTSTSSISGLVKDASGAAIGSALVHIKGTNLRTETDDSGTFKLTVPAGKYTLSISRVGFKDQNRSVVVNEGQDLNVSDVILSGVQDMNEVNIAGKTQAKTTKEQGFNVNVIDMKQLYNTGADLNQALTRTSGVRVREDGGLGSNFNFSLNGFSGRQVKFFLDGIPMDNFGSSLTLNNFPVNMAERIEVYKGVIPVTLGADALGGAVNIVTRTNPNFLDFSYGYGSFNTHRAALNHAYTNAKSGFTLRTNVFYNYSDNNYKVNVQPIDLLSGQRGPEQEVERFHDGYESAAIQMEAGVTGKRYADKLLFGLIVSGNDKDIQTGVTMDQVFGGRTSTSSAVIPTLKYKKADVLVKGLDLSLYGAYNMSRNKFIDTARLKYNWLQETLPTETGELSRSQLKNKDNEGLVTANLGYRLQEHQTLSLNYVMTDFKRKSTDVEDPGNITFQYPQQLNKQIIGLGWQTNYGGFTASVFSKLYLLDANSFEQVPNGTGAPTFRASSTRSNDVGYGAAAAYFILPELQAKASFEHTYRLPEAIELLGDGLYVRRNSALKPEQSNNLNLGAIYSLRLNDAHRFGIEASYIYRNAQDYIRLDQAQTQPVDRQYVNIGDVITNGIEGEIRYSWMNRFQAKVNMTYQNIIDKQEFLVSENLTGTRIDPNLNYGYKVPNMPYLFGNADLSYLFTEVGGKGNSLDLSYSVNFVEKYYFTPHQLGENNGDIIPTQFAHNLMANYIIQNGKYSIALESRNFMDNKLFDNYLMQKPGRSFFLKLRYFISR
jgi:outer membrane receptor protein involved in Fe transport